MNLRIAKENLEDVILNEYACKSKNSKGREKFEEQCDLRTCFQRDRDRILHSKAFRRLKDKTQVFIAPECDHLRTRLTHTLEVSQVARTIASCLNFNEDLTEAIALGHDLGHSPFGHLGEDILNEIVKDGFCHNKQSVRVVQKIEKDGQGLNLTKEVLDGMLNHRGAGNPSTIEGKIVQISDKIAYINHDVDDAIRANIITIDEIPKDILEILGKTPIDIINFLVRDIIKNSYGKNDIIMTTEVKQSMYELRAFLFKHFYGTDSLKEERENNAFIVKDIYAYYSKNFHEIPNEFVNACFFHRSPKERIICDYIAGMSDRYIKLLHDKIIK